MTSWFLNAGLLFKHAKDAHGRTSGAATPTTGGQSDALTAVVFSAVSLEAFINELVDLTSDYLDKKSSRARWIALTTILDDFERSRASLESKFLAAKWILAGETFEKGHRPYQDFKLLIDLRNGLVHYRSDRFDVDPMTTVPRSTKPPAFMAGLESKGLTANFIYAPQASGDDSPKEVIASWLARISTPALARWACNSSAYMVHSILESLPKDSVGAIVRHIYTDAFEPIP